MEREKTFIMFPHEKKRAKKKREKFFVSLFATILGAFFLFACAHTPPEDSLTHGVDKSTQVFDASEKIIVRAIKHVLKERGFGQAKLEKIGEDESHLETDYVIEGDWRTKMTATIKKVSRKEREVTLFVTTEQKDSGPSGWKAKKLVGKGQYEKIFNEIEMQIYREWAKGE